MNKLSPYAFVLSVGLGLSAVGVQAENVAPLNTSTDLRLASNNAALQKALVAPVPLQTKLSAVDSVQQLQAELLGDSVSKAEKQLVNSLSSMQQLAFTDALQQAKALADAMPEYQLAQLLKAELYAIRAGKTEWLSQQRKRYRKKSTALLSEAQVRWQQQDAKEIQENLLSRYVLKAASNEPYLVIVDSLAHRLHLYRKQAEGYQSVADFYVSIGRQGTGKEVRGDLKTPIGVYQIVKELPDSKLPELYGVAALTLNYPNSLDKQKGRTGSGIWLHGTPRTTYSRAPLASRGCVVLNNPAMQALITQYQLNPATPVIITASKQSELGLLSASSEHKVGEAQNQQQVVLSQINQWLRNQQTYQVDWEAVSVYTYPGEQGVYYVSFPNKDGQLIEQYWQQHDSGNWKMVASNAAF